MPGAAGAPDRPPYAACVLVLLPPSEGKFTPSRGRPVDLSALSFPALTSSRRQVLETLVTLCRGDAEVARLTLDLPPGLAHEVARNARLPEAPAAPAGRIYTGVLYDALGLGSLSPAAKRRASSRLLVMSSLFGVVRPLDRIPAYRLSGNASLPGVGTISSVWRQVLDEAMRPVVDRHLVVDLRSGTYGGFWRPDKTRERRVVSVRVLHEANGTRSVVSHFNKATKGRIVRSLLEDGTDPRTPAAFVTTLARLGWQLEPTPDRPFSYDVIVTDV